jgi:hypothetical protein
MVDMCQPGRGRWRLVAPGGGAGAFGATIVAFGVAARAARSAIRLRSFQAFGRIAAVY